MLLNKLTYHQRLTMPRCWAYKLLPTSVMAGVRSTFLTVPLIAFPTRKPPPVSERRWMTVRDGSAPI
jgi:hypothetical protein